MKLAALMLVYLTVVCANDRKKHGEKEKAKGSDDVSPKIRFGSDPNYDRRFSDHSSRFGFDDIQNPFGSSGFISSPLAEHGSFAPIGFGGGEFGGFGGGQHQLGFPGHHIGPIIPATDPLSAAMSGNPLNIPVSNGCRFWCRTPQLQAYCCEDVNQVQSAVFTKPGVCPPVRPFCPPVRSFGPPAPCSNDGSCAGVDKCCFDTCLQEHSCKPPQGIGR